MVQKEESENCPDVHATFTVDYNISTQTRAAKAPPYPKWLLRRARPFSSYTPRTDLMLCSGMVVLWLGFPVCNGMLTPRVRTSLEDCRLHAHRATRGPPNPSRRFRGRSRGIPLIVSGLFFCHVHGTPHLRKWFTPWTVTIHGQ